MSGRVPARIGFPTSGVSRRASLGKSTLVFRRATLRKLLGAGRPVGLVIQAICHLRTNPELSHRVAQLKTRLAAKTKAEMKSPSPKMPAWMRSINPPAVHTSAMKKSTAVSVSRCDPMKSCQSIFFPRSGAGAIPCRFKMLATVSPLIWCPRLLNAPAMRL